MADLSKRLQHTLAITCVDILEPLYNDVRMTRGTVGEAETVWAWEDGVDKCVAIVDAYHAIKGRRAPDIDLSPLTVILTRIRSQPDLLELALFALRNVR